MMQTSFQGERCNAKTSETNVKYENSLMHDEKHVSSEHKPGQEG